ncbi:MAG: hypothetical protein JXR03_06095 [Cyclobacteriaceae bacterium]
MIGLLFIMIALFAMRPAVYLITGFVLLIIKAFRLFKLGISSLVSPKSILA